jgi:two-component system, NtrC family, sensor histidine kinase PilS
VISETFKLLRNSHEIVDGHILRDDLPERPAIVSGDPEQLKQVCWNIARNALTAMPAGGTLRVSLEEAGDNRLRITFADDGRGMTPEQVEHLFEPLRRAGQGWGSRSFIKLSATIMVQLTCAVAREKERLLR